MFRFVFGHVRPVNIRNTCSSVLGKLQAGPSPRSQTQWGFNEPLGI